MSAKIYGVRSGGETFRRTNLALFATENFPDYENIRWEFLIPRKNVFQFYPNFKDKFSAPVLIRLVRQDTARLNGETFSVY